MAATAKKTVITSLGSAFVGSAFVSAFVSAFLSPVVSVCRSF